MDPRVVVYRTPYCPYCTMAERLLTQEGIPFEEIDVSSDPERRRWLISATGQRTVPQIFINGRSVGGFTELSALHRRGELPAWLAREPAPDSEDAIP
jgi:glutaredoxin 3